ncbi:Hexapeptide repeat of succinyl-transferase [Pseudozobellia thermophila]|uniref:Hexapeptide repeat of succinyl-transferase n=1 Tax=Pseudozobellia thermophila TaxID=192903 RepID=A0A1M6KR22_9FLAO|nr:Hexapeptide repeat of succinyl-transferase [Pseudozobellia thermophila]
MIVIIYKALRKIIFWVQNRVNKLVTLLILKGNNVGYAKFSTNGIPYVMVARGGKMSVGNHFSMNNGINGSPNGCRGKCAFFVDKDAVLTIGENVGATQATIRCHSKITIGNYVNIGRGAKIFDTDFHALDPKLRSSKDDLLHRKEAPVVIKDRAFIGAYSIILKGVTIGENAIVGAGSVVTKSVPDNQIWAGNPAKFIRSI